MAKHTWMIQVETKLTDRTAEMANSGEPFLLKVDLAEAARAKTYCSRCGLDYVQAKNQECIDRRRR